VSADDATAREPASEPGPEPVSEPAPDARTAPTTAPSPPGAWFETIGSRQVHVGFSTVRVDTVRMPDGSEVEREIVVRPDAVGVVPLTDDGRVLLIKQYRQPLGRYQLEIPAGLLDVAGEPVEDAARREVAEELHHEVRELLHLTSYYSSVGWSDEQTHVYLGRGLTPSDPPEGFQAEAEEAHLEVVPFTAADALELARAGELTDAKTLIGILLAAPYLTG
jgi:8-oxo-dGDP phosphatase